MALWRWALISHAVLCTEACLGSGTEMNSVSRQKSLWEFRRCLWNWKPGKTISVGMFFPLQDDVSTSVNEPDSLAQSSLMCPLCCIIHTNHSLCKKQRLWCFCFFGLPTGVTVSRTSDHQTEGNRSVTLFIPSVSNGDMGADRNDARQPAWLVSQSGFISWEILCLVADTSAKKRQSTS